MPHHISCSGKHILAVILLFSLLLTSGCFGNSPGPPTNVKTQSAISQNITKDYDVTPRDLKKSVMGLGTKHALIIGIENYPIKPLPYAAEDAVRVGLVLAARYGFEVTVLMEPDNALEAKLRDFMAGKKSEKGGNAKGRITWFTDREKITRAGIVDALGSLTKRVGPNDQVIVFFSGHGEPIRQSGKITGGYLVPVNGNSEKHSTLIPMDMIRFYLKQIPARHILFIIDTCYSGFSAGTSVSMSNLPEQTLAYVSGKMEKPGRQVITAGDSEQEALMLDEYGMSVFSHYLEEALKGNADCTGHGNNDGVITMSELFNYVEKKVSLKTGHQQRPLFRNYYEQGTGELVFVPENFVEEMVSQEKDTILAQLKETELKSRERAEEAEKLKKKIEANRKREIEALKQVQALRKEQEDAETLRKKTEEMIKKQQQASKEGPIVVPCDDCPSGMSIVVPEASMPVQPKYSLRRKPVTVSSKKFKTVFGLDGNWRPLKYIINEYHDNGDGTITDNATGLMWQQSGSDKYMQFKDVPSYINNLNRKQFAGYNDWRLPTIPELMSLLEPKRNNGDLYIDPLFDKKQRWCWSSDRRSPGSAWGVSFLGGDVRWYLLGRNYYVRAVRVRQ